jgi:hypothetical protein
LNSTLELDCGTLQFHKSDACFIQQMRVETKLHTFMLFYLAVVESIGAMKRKLRQSFKEASP